MPSLLVRTLTLAELLALEEIVYDVSSDVLSVTIMPERTRVLFGRRDASGRPLGLVMSSSRS